MIFDDLLISCRCILWPSRVQLLPKFRIEFRSAGRTDLRQGWRKAAGPKTLPFRDS